MRRRDRHVASSSIAGVLAATAFVASAVVPGASPPALALDLLPPIAVPDSLSTKHDRTRVVPPPGVLANDLDLDGGTVAVLVSGTTHGSVTLRSDGGYTYTPDAGYVGSDSFRYRASSGLLDSLATTVSITVTNVRPSVKPDAYSVAAGTPKTVGPAGVLANDSDSDGDALTADLVSGPSHGTVDLASSGGFTYVPASGYAGGDTFTYRAWDGAQWSASTTVSLTIAPSPTPKPTATPEPIPAPTAKPTPAPTRTPTAKSTATPEPTAKPTATPEPTARSTPRSTVGLVPTPTSRPGRATPAAARTARPSAEPSGGGFATGGGSRGASGGPPGEPQAVDVQRLRFGLADAVVADLSVAGGFEWAVPAFALAVPGMFLVLALGAQAWIGTIWVAYSRRRLRGLGVRSGLR